MSSDLRSRTTDLRTRIADLRSRTTAMIVAGVTEPPAPRSARLRRGRVDLVFAADVVLAVILFGVTDSYLTNHRHQLGTGDAFLLFLLSVLVSAPLIVRTSFPLTSWSASAVGLILGSVVLGPGTSSTAAYIPGGVVVYVLCLYAVAIRCKPWVVITAGLVTVIGGAVIESQSTSVAIIAAAAPVFIGVIVRSRRGSREQLEVAERRHEGERALLEERQRIARELHDVVAHHMSVIAIQAEAGPYKAADPPPELVESFGEIRASALSGLNELRRVLGVLRSDQPDTAPQPGLEDLPGLIESARAGGVTVSTDVTGTARPLPDGVNLSAYRIVQEGLSNAMRHAPGSKVQLNLFYGVAALVIEIRNNGARPAPGSPDPQRWAGLGGGHGIIGMRERAAMLGGTLTAGPTPAGEFLVTASLPLGVRAGEKSTEETR